MIICEVNKNHLNVRTKELLTAGSQNVNTVEFRFNAAWDGLAKTATFKTSKKTISVLLGTNTTEIPWEVLADAGEILAVGVFGVLGETIVLPTVWGILGKVMDAAHLGEEEKEPTPDVYQKILDELNSLEKPTWAAVQNKPFESLGDGLEVDENGVLSAKGGTGGSPNAVQYVAQELTDEQKTQARRNIDADKKRLIYNATRGNYGRVNLFDSVSSQNAAIDKIIAEYKAGTEVVMRLQGSDYQLNRINENAGKIWFSSYSVTTDAKMNVVTFMLEKDTTAVEESFINGIKPVNIDRTLQASGYAADAKAVGDALAEKADTTDIPNVPAWAMADEKPKYTAAEVGALPDDTIIPPPYTLPQATADALGGIKADAATAEDTQDVRIGADGKMKTKPYTLTDADKTAVAEEVVADGIAATLMNLPSGGGGTWTKIHEETLAEDVNSYIYPLDNVKAAAIVISPNANIAGGWMHATLGNKNIPLTTASIDVHMSICLMADIEAIVKLIAILAHSSNIVSYGTASGKMMPALGIDDLTEINQIGTPTSRLLVAGAKIEIYTKG